MKQNTLFLIILFILIALIVIYFFLKKETVFEKTVRIEEELKQLVKEIDIYNRLYPRKQMITIPVYYINMDKSKDRNEWMIEQLSKNVERYYRVSGVNGYEIQNKEHDTVDGLEFYNDFKDLTLPQIGCTLSHLKAIQTAYENGENIVIIMEDDVYVDMTNLLDDSVEEFVKNAPEEWEILQLVHLGSNLNKSSKMFKEYTFHPHTRGNYESCTSSYLINRKGMENILKRLGRNPYYLDINTSDSGVSDCIIYDNATTFIIEPSIVTPIHIQIDLEKSLNILKKYKKPIVIKGSTLKILNLIIYNENEEYERQMKHELEIYLKQFKNNVIFYFIAYRETQKDYITIEDNCIYIKGKEGFVPQVLDKTIIALEYCIKNLNINFDFFVRSNISSVINFNAFPINELDYTNVYTGAYVLKLDWLDPPYGINSKNIHKLKGLKFASGTSIIMSKDVAEYLVEYRRKLDRTIIDDVSIGFLLSTKYKILKIETPNKFIVNEINKEAFVIRNKSENRYDDISRMVKINNFKTLKDGITFIIPTIGRKTLKYTVESLQNLNVQDWKAIILFDGVKPTLEVEDERFKIVTLKKIGKLNHAGNVRNQGIKIADTKWVGFVDDDDTLLPNYLDIFKDIVNKSNPDVIIFRMLNSDGRILPPKEDKDFSINNVGISFCLQKKHMIENNIWFSPSSTEDFDLLNKLRNANKNIIISKDIAYIVR